MERTKLLTIAVIGLFLLNLITIGFLLLKPNRPPHPGGPGGAEEPATVIIGRLRFDAGQQKVYRGLITNHQEQTRALNEEMVQLYRDYYGLLAMSPPDSARANTLSQQIANNQRAQAQLNFTHFKQIKALCRPDQQGDFTELAKDLARLFGRQQRPPRRSPDGPPEGRPDESPENLPPHP
ncbi:periplasmic heavy metal sensor [Spirosoma sp. KCTC 42546]|uniref:periplasmic heavy metal sensor n=1 Tax=Spirosoma sp. KCTC 42546 TaxID=2520506 RepID=UPI001157AB52|nr:periplasmic heavy metal sensor [Spirosoma sp. KCTC 42546]QDK77096.1 periplasmic heavy metal sensor [Spirosoma sp. KCTC 42546]